MAKPSRTESRLLALFMLGCLLFNYPLVALFNVRATVLGIPALYAYLFSAWALLIVLGAPAPDPMRIAWWRSVASAVTAGAHCSVHVVRAPQRGSAAAPLAGVTGSA